MDLAVEKSRGNVGFLEKLAYACGDTGNNIVWMMVSGFAMLYYTDFAGLNPAGIATMMFIIRLLDGFTDIIMGTIIDRTNTKWGKARPWVFVSAPLMGLGLILLFNVSGGYSDSGKLVYAYMTYGFLTAIVYTVSNLSFNTMISLISPSQKDRTALIAFKGIFTMIMVGIISSLIPGLIAEHGFAKLSIIFGVISILLILISSVGVRERVYRPRKEKQKTSMEFKAVFKNKYFWLISIYTVLIYLSFGIGSASGIYYLRDVIKSMDLYGMFIIAGSPLVLIGLGILPKLAGKYGKWKVMMAITGICALSRIPLFFFPESAYVLLAMVAVKSTMLVSAAAMFAYYADVVDYGEYKTGIRADGLVYSGTSFGMKIGTGLGAAAFGWMLGWAGYTAGEITETSIFAIKAGVIYLPLALYLLMFVILAFGNIDKLRPEVERALGQDVVE